MRHSAFTWSFAYVQLLRAGPVLFAGKAAAKLK